MVVGGSWGSTQAAVARGIHRSQDPRVVIIEYEVHGKIVRTGPSYDNRFISVVTIEDRKIVQWRDYMDSLTAMTALTQEQDPLRAIPKDTLLGQIDEGA